MSKRNEMVFDLSIQHLIPTVVFMGGGYSDPIDHTIDAFVDLFVSASQANKQILSKSDLETSNPIN
jgi:acetoin utilization deacetylase AcuC-like enzyme